MYPINLSMNDLKTIIIYSQVLVRFGWVRIIRFGWVRIFRFGWVRIVRFGWVRIVRFDQV